MVPRPKTRVNRAVVEDVAGLTAIVLLGLFYLARPQEWPKEKLLGVSRQASITTHDSYIDYVRSW